MSTRITPAEHLVRRAEVLRQLDRGVLVFCAMCGEAILPCWPAPSGRTPHREHVVDCKRRDCNGRCWAMWELSRTRGSAPEHFACRHTRAGRAAALKTNRARAARGLVDPEKVMPMIRREW